MATAVPIQATAFVLTFHFSATKTRPGQRGTVTRWLRFPLFSCKDPLSSHLCHFVFIHSSDTYRLVATFHHPFLTSSFLHFDFLLSSDFDFTQSLLSTRCWHADVKAGHHHDTGLAQIDTELQLLCGLCPGLQVLWRLFIQILVYLNCWKGKLMFSYTVCHQRSFKIWTTTYIKRTFCSYLHSPIHLLGSIISRILVSSSSSNNTSCFALSSFTCCCLLSSIFSLLLKYCRP